MFWRDPMLQFPHLHLHNVHTHSVYGWKIRGRENARQKEGKYLHRSFSAKKKQNKQLRTSTLPSSSETQGLLVGTMRYFRASDIFGAKVFFQGWRAPGHFFLPNEFQKCRNLSRWLARKIFFRPINEEILPGNPVSLLHKVVFFIDRTGRFPWGVQEKKDLTKPRKSQTVT